MNNTTKNILFISVGLIIGVAATLIMKNEGVLEQSNATEKEPKYWVAPMDANYRRDAPGKSPMGMNLIPVFDEAGSALGEYGPGTIRIDPDVENNLGVRTASVVKAPLHTKIDTVGYIGYDEDRLIHIHPRVEGWLDNLYVKSEGDKVIKGQPLYAIYSPTLVSAQEELLIALNRGNRQLIRSAETRLKALQVPEAQISARKKDKAVQQTITILSPQDGIVAGLSVREGMYVKPGNSIVSIGALDQVWVIAEVFERQVAHLKNKATVEMRLDYVPGRTWHGLVDYIYPTLDAKTRTVKVRLRFDNKDSVLKPNMYARVVIHSDDATPVLLVPVESVIRTGSQNRVVLALGKGKYKSVAIKVGRTGNSQTEVLEGLNENDNIVVSAHFLLDSESSIDSDFVRQNHDSDVPTGHEMHEHKTMPEAMKMPEDKLISEDKAMPNMQTERQEFMPMNHVDHQNH